MGVESGPTTPDRPLSMPIYEYRTAGETSCAHCADGFDAMQKISEAALTECPRCGAPVQRQISAPRIARPGPSLDRANLEKHGFTQYRKSGKGVYEKTAGKGPDVISDD